jgi:hypothetical protein
MSIVNDIAEMICIANGERYESKSPTEQQHINTWAHSIFEYVNTKSQG